MKAWIRDWLLQSPLGARIVALYHWHVSARPNRRRAARAERLQQRFARRLTALLKRDITASFGPGADVRASTLVAQAKRDANRWWLIIPVLLLVAGCSSPTMPTPAKPTDIQGQWGGIYVVTSCTLAGAAQGTTFCTSLTDGGGMVFTPQQSGASVTGTLGIGGFNIPVTGTVNPQGVVVLSGSGPIVLGATLTLSTWRGTVAANTMTGTTQYTIITDAPIGSATVAGTFTLQR